MEDGAVPFSGLGLLYAKLGQVNGQQLKSAIQGGLLKVFFRGATRTCISPRKIRSMSSFS
jgi:hypothetical protein